MNEKNEKLQGIAKLIGLSSGEYELIRLLDDLLTDAEIDKIHERIKIVACLKDGLSQRDAQKKTEAAIATVTRGASLLKKPQFILDRVITSAQKMSWWYKLFWQS